MKTMSGFVGLFALPSSYKDDAIGDLHFHRELALESSHDDGP